MYFLINSLGHIFLEGFYLFAELIENLIGIPGLYFLWIELGVPKNASNAYHLKFQTEKEFILLLGSLYFLFLKQVLCKLASPL